MKYKFTKKQIMEHYYSDEELKDSMRMSVKRTLQWLEEARRFFNKITPRMTKNIRDKLIAEGW